MNIMLYIYAPIIHTLHRRELMNAGTGNLHSSSRCAPCF